MRGKWGISYGLPCLFAWACLFLCKEKSAGKKLLVKAMKGDDFQISLWIFHTTLHQIFGKLLLKSAPLKGCAFLP